MTSRLATYMVVLVGLITNARTNLNDDAPFCKLPAGDSKMYPYGKCVGDVMMDYSDDAYERLDCGVRFTFFGKQYDKLWVCTNGYIALDGGLDQFSPTVFPQNHAIISPYWADVDNRERIGRIFYRQETSGPLLKNATNHIRAALLGIREFTAKLVIVVTWHDVTFYGSTPEPGFGIKKNTFQAVMVSDGDRTYAFFIYDKLTWSTAKYGGNVRPQIGFDAGDMLNYYSVPGFSFTDKALNLTHITNIQGPGMGYDGCWLFQFNLVGTLAPVMQCLQSATCCVMQGNVYTVNHNCTTFSQWDYLNHPNPNTNTQYCPEGKQFNTSPTECTCSRVDADNRCYDK